MVTHFFVTLLFLAGFVCAQNLGSSNNEIRNTNKELKGSYSVLSTGIGFEYLKSKISDHEENAENIYKHKYTGFSAPIINYRVGVSTANLLAFYTLIGFAPYYGTLDYSKTGTSNKSKKGVFALHAKTSAGIGVSFYPFQSSDIFNGIFIGGNALYTISAMNNGYLTADFGTSFQSEIGKDWRISDHSFIGFSISFTQTTSCTTYDINKPKNHTFEFMLRFTNG